MPGDFIPLLSSVKSNLPGGAAAAFTPIASASGNSGALSLAAKQLIAPAGHAHREMSVEIKRDGERISQIRIQCRCGELIELDCEY
jgi:hypothetical protein